VDRIADYELIRSLGWGNHGQFFLARKPDRLPVDVEYVAVKVFAGTSTDATFRRATRELQAFAAVRSPYMVSLYDAGQHDGVLYYSMEYLERGSLATPDKPVTQTQAITAVRDAALAVAALHAAGMVHRDIKPGNIMLTETGGKLSDLGLAHVIAPGVTVTGMGPVASIEYTDPEQLQGAPASPATDIFALGVTLHRVLSGKGIYGQDLPSDDGLLALRRVMTATVELAPDLPSGAAELISACIGPGDQRPTAEEFAQRTSTLIGDHGRGRESAGQKTVAAKRR
jgi:eukaryotic-like serine/threonine-protein kinase